MATIITEYRFPAPVSDEQLAAHARDLDPALARRDASWRRSYLSQDRLRMVCEYEAPDDDAVAAAHREESVPFEAVFSTQRWTIEELEQERAHEQLERADDAEHARKIVEPALARS